MVQSDVIEDVPALGDASPFGSVPPEANGVSHGSIDTAPAPVVHIFEPEHQTVALDDPARFADHQLVEASAIDDLPPIDEPESEENIRRPPPSAIRPFAPAVAPAREASKRPTRTIVNVVAAGCLVLLAIGAFAYLRTTHATDSPIVTTLPTRLAATSPITQTTTSSTRPVVKHRSKTRPSPLPKPKPKPKLRPKPKQTARAKPKKTLQPAPKPTTIPPHKKKQNHVVILPKRTAPLALPREPVLAPAFASQALVARSNLGRGGTAAFASPASSVLADLRWHKLGAAQWQLLTINGASVHLIGKIGSGAFSALDAGTLANYSYLRDAFPSISGNDLNGDVLAVRTNAGAVAKVYVSESSYRITLYYHLYPRPAK